ncbi:DNA binding protein [Bacillus phage YungSlug]|nr:DNA binding protein [Bacillus phage YungSlug]
MLEEKEYKAFMALAKSIRAGQDIRKEYGNDYRIENMVVFAGALHTAYIELYNNWPSVKEVYASLYKLQRHGLVNVNKRGRYRSASFGLSQKGIEYIKSLKGAK